MSFQCTVNASPSLACGSAEDRAIRWYVGDDAPMLLREDWYELMPDGEKWRAKPGHYRLLDEMDRDARVAEWIERQQGQADRSA